MTHRRRKRKAPLDDDGRPARCAYCRRHLQPFGSLSSAAATRDHVVPQVRGGTATVFACFTCNGLKGQMGPDEWRTFMLMAPLWWVVHPLKPGPAGHK